MFNILNILIRLLVFPGALFVIVFGLLMAGIDRKVLAHMQKRIGPPITQPMYDFIKLTGKETIVPAYANRIVFLWAPVIGLISLIILTQFIPIFGFSPLSTSSDLVVVLYLMTVPGLALMLGGSASGSPYAAIGMSREMVTMIAYELPFIMVLLTVARKTASIGLNFSLQNVISYQAANGSLILDPAMIPAAIAMLLIIPAEVGLAPFDVAEAETEICEGPLVEYSGSSLGIFKLNTAMKMFIMPALFTALFLGGLGTGNLAIDTLILIVVVVIVVILSMTLIHAVTARLKVEQLFKFYWTFVSALAALSLIMAWMGL